MTKLQNLDNRKIKNWSILIFLTALVVRFIFLLQFQSSVLFDNHIVDMAYHHEWAKAIADGIEYYDGPFFRAPLYPLFLGAVYYILGESSWFIRIIQIIIGSMSAVLIFLIGLRVFNFKTALLSGLITAFCGLMIYYDGQLLATSFFIFLNLWALYFLISSIDRPTMLNIIMSGFFIGLSAITRPNILSFAIILIVWILWIIIKKRELFSFKHLGILILGIVIPILPVTAYNYSQTSDFIPIGAYGGINFYIANNTYGADGVSPVLPGVRKDWWGGKEDTKRIAETESGRKLSEAEQSDFWFDKTVDEISDDPIRFTKLLFKKSVLIISGVELSNNFDFYFFAREALIQKILIWRGFLFFPWGLLIPLAVVGLFAVNYKDRKQQLLILFLLGYVFSLLLFLISSRYRLPLLPVLILLASHGLFNLIERLKDYKALKNLSIFSIFVLAIIICNIDFYGYGNVSYAHGYHTTATVYAQNGNDIQAEKYYRKALEGDSELSESINDLSMLLVSKGQFNDAVELLSKGISENPDDFLMHYNLGFAYLEMRKPESAIAPLLKSFELNPKYLFTTNNLGLAYLRTGQLEKADELFDKALELDNSYIPALYNQAYIHEENNQFHKAIATYQNIKSINQEDVEPDFYIAVNWMALNNLDSSRHYFEKIVNSNIGDNQLRFEATRLLDSLSN